MEVPCSQDFQARLSRDFAPVYELLPYLCLSQLYLLC